MRETIRQVDEGTIAGYSSVITLTEVLTQPKQIAAISVESEYRDLLLYSRHFVLVPIHTDIAESAADLRARYNLRTPDALQIAAAIAVGCEVFLTNDDRLKRVKELRVLVLSELEIGEDRSSGEQSESKE